MSASEFRPRAQVAKGLEASSFLILFLFSLHPQIFEDDHLVQLISLQNADGSWCLNEGLAVVLGVSLEEILAALPLKVRLREEKGAFAF